MGADGPGRRRPGTPGWSAGRGGFSLCTGPVVSGAYRRRMHRPGEGFRYAAAHHPGERAHHPAHHPENYRTTPPSSGAANCGSITIWLFIHTFREGSVSTGERSENIRRNPLKRDIRGFRNRRVGRGQKCDARRINAGKRAKMGRKSNISREIVGVFGWK